MDQICISNLEVFGNHGVYVEENTLGQKFLISATLYTDTRKAGHTDNIEDSIHYGSVCQDIKTMMEGENFNLLEAVAEQIAEKLLLKYALLKKIELEIKKPWAPIKLPLDTVSVKITRGWHSVYIGLGSNMGDRAEHLAYAVSSLEDHPQIKACEFSEYYETKPYGGVEQEDFLNACAKIETLLTPEELLDVLHKIEADRGRERKIHWGPRTLDLDILYYDREIIDTKRLCIPHPEIPLRKFVLEPLQDLAPYYRDPVTGKTVAQMLGELANEATR